MYQLCICIIILTLSLISCSGGVLDSAGDSSLDSAGDSNTEVDKNFVKNRCINHKFAQGQDENLYGLECLEGKHLVIKTSDKGDLVSTSAVSNNDTGLRLADDLKFKNKFYTSSYTILDQGDDKDNLYAFLSKFLPPDEKFHGALNTQYRIIFYTDGNYLTLYKASKKLTDLPHTEIHSLQMLRNGEILDYDPDSHKKEEGDYYIAPFIGYSIKYCKAEARTVNGVEYNENIITCEDSHLQKALYIKVNLNSKAIYNYQEELKKDLFPSDYFDGQWYYSTGPIESSKTEELAPVNAHLITIEKGADGFNLKDASGDVQEINRRILGEIPVKWQSFEKDQEGNNQFITYGERKKTSEDKTNHPYVQIDFTQMEGDLIELIITQDYLSYIQTAVRYGKTVKVKTSFLRAGSVETEGFTPRKWFLDDHNNIFGILKASPQKEKQRADNSENQKFSHARMIRFNTSLNTEEEKHTKTKTIKWHLSKNSTTDPAYIEIAERAVQIYNQAFSYISQKIKVKVELEKEERKDLGDLRYNIINLVRSEALSNTGLFGIAPSYVNPNTGQIIATTANILIHNLENTFDEHVRNYIRYEVFQRDKRTEAENEIHVVTHHIRELIQKKCSNIKDFIIEKKQELLKQSTPLNDRDLIIKCGKELTKQALLWLILHEMGHSFGLGHNFKASIDNENYYKNEDEIKKIFNAGGPFEKTAQSSSVMDYLSNDHPTMNYLGKYDLAALRYLYFNEIELENGEIATLNINSDLKKQQAFEKRKKYLHCSDNLKKALIMCDADDYGGNPKEIVEELLLQAKRALNSIRYRYDLAEDIFRINLNFLTEKIVTPLRSASDFYRKWLEFRDGYLIDLHASTNLTNFVLGDEASIDQYIDVIENNKKTENDDLDLYTLYYPMRDMVSEFIMELIDLTEMTCHFEDENKDTYSWTLESIKRYIKPKYNGNLAGNLAGNLFYVEDCYSPQIVSFFTGTGLTLKGQTGYENFLSYHLPSNSESKLDVITLTAIHKAITSTLMDPRFNYYMQTQKKYVFSWWDEPDKLKNLTEKVSQKTLNVEDNTSPFESSKNKTLLGMVDLGLERSLNTDAERGFLKEHKNNTATVKYNLGTDQGSFYRQIIEPLSKGVNISQIEIPFLEAVYEKYSKEKAEDPKIGAFESYVKQQEDVLNENRVLVMPFTTNSLVAKAIKKYNENKKQLNQLNRNKKTQEETNIIEIFKEQALIQHNQTLADLLGL